MDSYSYDAFDNVRARTGANTQPYQYVGNSYDSTAKLRRSQPSMPSTSSRARGTEPPERLTCKASSSCRAL